MQVFDSSTVGSRLERCGKARSTVSALLLVLLLSISGRSPCAAAQLPLGALEGELTPAEIVWRMVAQNHTGAQRVKSFTATRHYHVDFQGAGRTMTADVHVQASSHAGSGEDLQIIDESGSYFLLNNVLKALLDAEQTDSREQSASLTPFNYDFNFETKADEGGRAFYVFSVKPKRRSRLLFRGRVWIDVEDYAVARMEARPTENPSLLIESTEIHRTFEKCGDSWLPESTRSQSKMRFGGTAVLTIDYGTYQCEEPLTASSTEESAGTGVAAQSHLR
jgi:hypothetical protein